MEAKAKMMWPIADAVVEALQGGRAICQCRHGSDHMEPVEDTRGGISFPTSPSPRRRRSFCRSYSARPRPPFLGATPSLFLSAPLLCDARTPPGAAIGCAARVSSRTGASLVINDRSCGGLPLGAYSPTKGLDT